MGIVILVEFDVPGLSVFQTVTNSSAVYAKALNLTLERMRGTRTMGRVKNSNSKGILDVNLSFWTVLVLILYV